MEEWIPERAVAVRLGLRREDFAALRKKAARGVDWRCGARGRVEWELCGLRRLLELCGLEKKTAASVAAGCGVK